MVGKYIFSKMENYEDYSSGRVLYSNPGAVAFPVRLVDEVFQRGASYLIQKGVLPPYSVYDPCCGGGYSATVLGYLHGDQIRAIYASDISPQALSLAKKNLSLLSCHGLKARMRELEGLICEFGKQSHKDAFQSAVRLQSRLESFHHTINSQCFCFDILGDKEFSCELESINLVIVDVPYGKGAHWQVEDGCINPSQGLLDKLKQILTNRSIVILATNKEEKILHSGYRKLAKLKIGKRCILILEPSI